MKPLRTLGVISIFLMLTACVTAPKLPEITRNPTNPIRTVAILPLVNNTHDVEGPGYVRDMFAAELGQFYYQVKPNNEVEQILKDQAGITLGSQLDMATPQKLGELLGVDGVFYGALEDFSDKTTGVYNVRRVRIRSKLVNCKTGETVWKNGVGIKQGTQSGGSEILKNIPYAGLAFSLAGSISSAVSRSQDKDDATALSPLFGEQVDAPWHALPEMSASVEANLFAGLAGKVVEKAMKSPLNREGLLAVSVLLKGYYYQVGQPAIQPYGTMLVTGPADLPAPVQAVTGSGEPATPVQAVTGPAEPAAPVKAINTSPAEAPATATPLPAPAETKKPGKAKR